MCEPVSMGALMVASEYQKQEAAQKAATAQNNRYKRNQAIQNEAYNKSLQASADERRDIKLQAFKNAEVAQEEKIRLMIESQEQMASLKMANLETASGQSSNRTIGVLRRNISNRIHDLKDQTEARQIGLERDYIASQRQDYKNYISAKSKITSVPMADYADQNTRILGLAVSGFQGYGMGEKWSNPDANTVTAVDIKKNAMKKPTTNKFDFLQDASSGVDIG